MVVAVQNGLPHLGEYLRHKGYDVVTLGEYPYVIDAVVYCQSSSALSMSAPSCGFHPGVHMINAQGKSFPEIHESLKNGWYESFL